MNNQKSKEKDAFSLSEQDNFSKITRNVSEINERPANLSSLSQKQASASDFSENSPDFQGKSIAFKPNSDTPLNESAKSKAFEVDNESYISENNVSKEENPHLDGKGVENQAFSSKKPPNALNNKDFLESIGKTVLDMLMSQGFMQENGKISDSDAQGSTYQPSKQLPGEGSEILNLDNPLVIAELEKSFPSISVDAIKSDKDFLLFLGGGQGDTISKKYLDFIKLKESLEQEAIRKYQARLASSSASVGSLSSNGSASQEFFSREQVMRMSKEQISKNFDKIRKSQARW